MGYILRLILVSLISNGVVGRTVPNDRSNAALEDLPQCIQTVEDMKDWFRYSARQPASHPRRHSLLDSSSSLIQKTLSVVFRYHIGGSKYNSSSRSAGNYSAHSLLTNSVLSSTCCDPKETEDCVVMSAFRKPMLYVMPRSLIFSLGSLTVDFLTLVKHDYWKRDCHLKFEKRMYCWTVPVQFCPFGMYSNNFKILDDFSRQILTNEHILESGVSISHNNKEPVTIRQLKDHAWHLPIPFSDQERRAVSYCHKVIVPYLAFFTFSLMATPLTIWAALRTHKYFSVVITPEYTQSKEMRQVQTTTRAAFLVSCWILFGMLYVGHYWNLKEYDTCSAREQFHDLSELAHNCTEPGFYMLYVYAAVTMIEIPLVAMYIFKSTKTTVSESTKVKEVVMWAKHTIASLGWSGMVFLMKILTGYLVYGVMLLSILPLFTLTRWVRIMTFSILFVFILSAFIHCFIHHKNLKIKSFIYLLYAILVAVNLIINSEFIYRLAQDNWSSVSTTSIMSTLLSTAMLSGIGYIIKRHLFSKSATIDTDEEMGARNMQCINLNSKNYRDSYLNSFDNRNAITNDEVCMVDILCNDEPMIDLDSH